MSKISGILLKHNIKYVVTKLKLVPRRAVKQDHTNETKQKIHVWSQHRGGSIDWNRPWLNEHPKDQRMRKESAASSLKAVSAGEIEAQLLITAGRSHVWSPTVETFLNVLKEHRELLAHCNLPEVGRNSTATKTKKLQTRVTLLQRLTDSYVSLNQSA